jgi:hypothetical protein
VRSRTARVMTTLMRNGRDRRSENPSGPKRYLSAGYCPGPISGSHQGQRPLRLHRHGGKPASENRPDTWLHPNASQKSQICSCNAGTVHTWPIASLAATQRFDRFRGRSGHWATIAIRSFLTHHVILRPPITALRKVYSITSSARASSVGGILRPSALAVLRLITSSNLVAC